MKFISITRDAQLTYIHTLFNLQKHKTLVLATAFKDHSMNQIMILIMLITFKDQMNQIMILITLIIFKDQMNQSMILITLITFKDLMN